MPAWGGAERLAGLVGRPQALLLTTTGERIDAAEALRIGLLDHVYPRESFESSWRSLASAVASSQSREIKKSSPRRPRTTICSWRKRRQQSSRVCGYLMPTGRPPTP
jgi:enoyl-CoA hydratase/carnithine racemase